MPVNEDYAAGIIPFIRDLNEIYLLLGREKCNRCWCGFVGGKDSTDRNVEDTAWREFNEETSQFFENQKLNIAKAFSDHNYKLLINHSPKRPVYIYLMEFSKKFLLENTVLTNLFLNKLNTMQKREYKEKDDIRWINLNELSEYKLLYIFKRDKHKIVGSLKDLTGVTSINSSFD
mgnify:CR=1 FL=1|tara:strand:+ start:124 stop:648 length:525 start_codon:yes stop_codon:yes gene_type:complete